MSRPDPRADIVDGSIEVPLDIAAKEDVARGIKMRFGELYFNEVLGLTLNKCQPETLIDLAEQHATAYREVQRLLTDCVERGVEFSPEMISKVRDYHAKQVDLLTGMAVRKVNAKEEAQASPD